MNDRSRPSRMQLGACSFDPARAELLGPNGEPVHLRPQSMRVLETLLAHSGTVVKREALTATVWPDVVVTDDSLVQCVRDIRRALGADHQLLHTVPRIGYRLDLVRLPETPVDGTPLRPSRPSSISWKLDRRGALMLTGLCVGMALLGLGWFYGVRHQAVDGARTTVVIRFRYDAPATALKESDAVFEAGSADQLADDVVRNTTLRALVVAGTASDASIADLTHRLGAQFIVDGRVNVWAVRGYLDALDASAGISGDMTADRGAELVKPAERAIALDSRLVLAHQARALGLVSQGRHAEAVQAAERALSLSPSDPQGFLVLANALVVNGRMAEAMRAIEQAQSRYPAPTALLDFVQAKVLWGNDRFDEAIAAASRCLERAPRFATCHAIRAVASDAMSRLEAAREDLKVYRVAVPGPPTSTLGPGSYGVPKLRNDWLADVRGEIGLPL